MLWIILSLSLLLVLILGLATWFLIQLLSRLMKDRAVERAETQQALLTTFSLLQQEKTELMNRLMSKDLPAYTTLTTLNQSLTTSNDPYYSKSDAAEAEQIALLAGQHVGLGDTLYGEDEAAQAYMTEIGLDGLTALADKDT